MAALTFCYDTLRTGGHFVCKYYQGNEEKDLELRLKKLFDKVHREKPESSRNVSIPFPSLPHPLITQAHRTYIHVMHPTSPLESLVNSALGEKEHFSTPLCLICLLNDSGESSEVIRPASSFGYQA